jgi:hypothetical protein
MRPGFLRGVAGAVLMALGSSLACADDLPDGPNRELVYQHCETCHSVQNLINTGGMSRAQWAEKLSMMEGYGLQVTPELKVLLVEYLATYLPPRGSDLPQRAGP